MRASPSLEPPPVATERVVTAPEEAAVATEAPDKTERRVPSHLPRVADVPETMAREDLPESQESLESPERIESLERLESLENPESQERIEVVTDLHSRVVREDLSEAAEVAADPLLELLAISLPPILAELK